MKFSFAEFAVGAFLLAAPGADAFWRMECRGRSGLALIDPLVNPGAKSSHAHTIAGGSGFSPTSGSDDLYNSDCTSCAVTQDKSAYWTPPLYFKDAATGEYQIVNQIGGMLAYYFLNYSPGTQGVGAITAYPKGFSMIAGENTLRHETDTKEARAIGFNCINYTPGRTPEPTLGRHHMPDKKFIDENCLNGIRAELMFPSCWDGKGLTGGPSNKAHVAYPSDVMTGSCPPEFPIRLPGLMFETQWDTNAFKGIPGEFVWSNGDPTGYGYHGDFITGWEEKTLQAAVDTCTHPSGLISDCPIFNIQSRVDSEKCFLSNGMAASEDLSGPFSSLPGNSPYTAGPEDAKAMAAAPAVKAVESPKAVNKVAEAKPAEVETPKAEVEAPKAEAEVEAPKAEAEAPKKVPVSEELPGGVFVENDAQEAEAAPAPTPAPVAPVALGEGQKISTTLYKTVGDNEVVEVVVIEEVVTVTEDVVTMTEYKTVNAYAKRHAHARRHAHGRHN